MSTKIHNVRFYNPKPRAIHSLSVHKSNNKLAVLRNDESIEIWNLQGAPFIERTILPDTTRYGVECIIWCKDRLFSCGREGFLLEYDLKALVCSRTSALTGGAAYCIDANPINGNLAIGTEQGYLNIFSTDGNELLFSKFLDKQEGQILCLKYDPSGTYIASGSIDTVRIWNVETGHALHRMTTGRSETNKVTIVWSIAITQDLTIISGDSRGKLTFWDGKAGAQIESYQSHKADLLTLCLSQDEKTLYCAGVDPNIMSYERIQVKDQKSKWVKSIQRKVHEHDVRALALVKNKLYSAGEDGYLSCSYHPPKTLIKYAPIISNPIQVCHTNRLMLMREHFSFDVWTLGASKDNESEKENCNLLPDEPKKILSTTKTARNGLKEAYLFVTMSKNGQYIACGTHTGVKIYKFNIADCFQKKESAIEFIDLPEELPICNNGAFITETQLVLLSRTSTTLFILNIKDNEAEIVQEIDVTKVFKDCVTHLKTSSCGKYIVAADPLSNIAVYVRAGKEFKYYCSLPRYEYSPTAVAINSDTDMLIVTYSDSRIVEFTLSKQKFSAFSRHLDHNNIKKLIKNYSIQNVLFDNRCKDVIILHDDSNVVTIDKSVKILDSKVPKIDSGEENVSGGAFKSIKKNKHLVYLGWVAEDELVAVEVSPLSLSEQLPPSLEQNTFGTK